MEKPRQGPSGLQVTRIRLGVTTSSNLRAFEITRLKEPHVPHDVRGH